MNTKDFDIQDFKGEDTTSPRGRLAPDVFRRFRNVKLDLTGLIVKTDAPSTIKSLAANKIWRYETVTTKRLMFTTYTYIAGSPNQYLIGLLHQDESSLGSAAVSAVSTGTLNADTVAAYYSATELNDPVLLQERDIMLMTVPAEKMYAWYGNITAASGKAAGTEVPVTAPTLGPNGTSSGVLNSIGSKPIPQYDYRYTYVTAHGQEGNPSAASTETNIDNESIDVDFATPVSAEITTARLYRRGGFATQYFKVADIALAAGVFPTYTDNIADVDLSNTRISFNNYAPPTGLDVMTSHRVRVYAAGSKGFGESTSPIRLWFSGIGKPEQWGREQSGLASDGGFFDMPGASSDAILALTSIGNILVVGRALSVYVLYGNTFADFNPSRRCETGIASKYAICRTTANEVYWIGKDRRIYRLTNEGSEMLSAPIQSSLNTISAANFATCRLVSHDNKMFITFGSAPASPDDISFVYDFTNSTWAEETDLISRDMVSQPPYTGSFRTPELIFADTGGIVKKAFADASAERYISVRTPEYEMPAVARAGKTLSSAYWSHVEGTITNGATSNTNTKVTLLADTYSRTYPIDATHGLNATEGILFSFRPDVDLFGRYISQQIEGKAIAFQLRRIVTSVQLEREDG